MTPTPIGPSPRVAKQPLSARDALRAALRLWLIHRDQAVWLLVSGAGADSGDPILDQVDFAPGLALVAKMNEMRALAYDWAAEIDAKHAESVLRAELDSLLASESPRFLLRVPESPGAF